MYTYMHLHVPDLTQFRRLDLNLKDLNEIDQYVAARILMKSIFNNNKDVRFQTFDLIRLKKKRDQIACF